MNENSVRLRTDQVEVAEAMAGGARFPKVSIARSKDGVFTISRDKDQIARFREALAEADATPYT